MKKAALGFGFVVLAAGGCSGGSQHGPASFTVNLPSWTVPAGQEVLKCVYQSMHNTQDVFVDKFVTEQIPGGHHLLGFLSTTTLPDGTEVDCASAQSMESFRPLLTGLSKSGFELPAGYAVRVPANATLVWQSHYVNATTSAIQTKDKIEVFFTPASPNLVQVQAYMVNRLGFDLAPHAISSDGQDCVVPQDLNVFAIFGHMHEWGKAVKIELGAPNALQPVYDVENWNTGFRDKPPMEQFPFDAPMQIHQGEHVKLTCTWDNTLDTDLTFPQEMCAGGLWVFPASDPIICSD